MPDNEFGYGTVAPAVSAKGNLLNPSAPIASVAMPKVIAPVAPPANAAPSSVQMPNVPQPQISQQQIQQMGDNTTSAVGNMVGNVMPGIIGTGGLALAGYGLSKIPSMLGKGKEEGKAPPESKQGIPAEVEKTQKVEEPKKENKYHLEQDHKELTKEELNKANEVFNTLDNIKTEPTTPKPETPAQQAIKTELKPVETNNPTSAIATTEPNPVVSGEGTSPLHNSAGQGLTQVEATSASATPNAAFPAETNTTKESGNLTNPAENPTQGGVEQIKKEVAPEKEFKSSTRIRMSKDDEERIKAIKEAGIAPTHQLTREEIANQQMHPEMKKIVEEGNVKIESNPELKSEIEKLKAGHKIPNGFVWIPDMGSGDIHFINTHGFEKYRQFKKEEMGGKPIGEYALNPKDKNYNPDLREKIKKWSERNYPTSNIAGVSEMTGEQKGKAAPEETNFFSKMGKLKPVAKTIAGVGGVMMALTELAQAREEAKHGNPNSAIGRVAKVATGFAPLATYTNETNSNEQEAMNKIRSQQKPIKGAVVPK